MLNLSCMNNRNCADGCCHQEVGGEPFLQGVITDACHLLPQREGDSRVDYSSDVLFISVHYTQVIHMYGGVSRHTVSSTYSLSDHQENPFMSMPE